MVDSTCPLSVKTVEIFMLTFMLFVFAVSGEVTCFVCLTTIFGYFFLIASTNSLAY